MPDKSSFDLQAAHRYFATRCFNRTWGYIEKAARSPEDDLTMLHTALASLWHWTQREDCTPENLSTGYWQVSRVYALLGQADNARRYGELCLKASEKLAPFYLGEANEALARAELTAGDRLKMQVHLEKARQLAEKITDEGDKRVLLNDLKTIS